MWTSFDTWIVVVGALCAVACALPGCFLVLRKMSMMGDAISHAVLPGLAIAFLVTGTRASVPMFLGAAIAGLLTALFTQWIMRFGNVDRGAAMGDEPTRDHDHRDVDATRHQCGGEHQMDVCVEYSMELIKLRRRKALIRYLL